MAYPGGALWGRDPPGSLKGRQKKRRKKERERRERKEKEEKKEKKEKKRKDRMVNQYNERGAIPERIISGRRRRPPPFSFLLQRYDASLCVGTSEKKNAPNCANLL